MLEILGEIVEVDLESIDSDTKLQTDLELTSLDVVNLITEFEDRFEIEIPDEDIRGFLTVGDMEKYLVQKISENMEE
ncbi:MAG: DUF1493 family protein [Lachnospiraceae bacterium]|nr:DUF1493 family protein [Lachnospiraceae bacterium]